MESTINKLLEKQLDNRFNEELDFIVQEDKEKLSIGIFVPEKCMK